MLDAFAKMPAKIRYSEISSTAKIIWSEIYCYNLFNIFNIKNKTLSKDLHISETQVSRIIKELINNHLLFCIFRENERKLIVIGVQESEKKIQKIEPNHKKNQEPSEGLKAFWSWLDEIKKDPA